MHDEWQTSVLVPIFKEKRDVRNCNAYREVKLLEHVKKIVERVLEKRIRKLVSVDAIQFDVVPGRGTIEALFVVRRMQEKYRNKKKLCFVK